MRGVRKIVAFSVFCASVLAAGDLHAHPSDEKQWLACEKDADCTAIRLGCYYWQPVNVKYADDMEAKYLSACLNSIDAGPQPSSSCVAHICINNKVAAGKNPNQETKPK